MVRKKSSADQKKKIILGALLLLMASVLVYQVFIKDPTPRRRTANNNAPSATTPSRPVPVSQPSGQTPASTPQPLAPDDPQALLADTTPLNLALLTQEPGNAKVSERGNVFAYYVEPIKPIPPPPPPPPITLQGAQPANAVAGTPHPFTLTVRGAGYPEDARIFFDGRPKETKRVNANTLSTEITPQDYSSPRSITIEVKSQSDPVKLYSTRVTFVVQAAPEPPFKYVGRIGKLGVFEMSGTKELTRLGEGDTIQSVWRIESITDTSVEVIHTKYEIKKSLRLPEKRSD